MFFKVVCFKFKTIIKKRPHGGTIILFFKAVKTKLHKYKNFETFWISDFMNYETVQMDVVSEICLI